MTAAQPAIDAAHPGRSLWDTAGALLTRFSRATTISAAVVLVLVGFAGLVWFMSIQQQANDWVRHTMQVEQQLYRLMTHFNDAETGTRGYLLTRDESYLAPYSNAMAAIDGEFMEAGRLLSDNTDQQRALATLKLQTAERMALLRQTIDLRRSGDQDGAVNAVRNGDGKIVMDRMRATIAQMVAREERLLDVRQEELARSTYALLIAIVVVFTAVLALGTFAIMSERRQSLGVAASRNKLAAVNQQLIQEAAHRGHVEHQLRQSQKMEAIGELTGGIAHDFNNILMVIMANVEALAERSDVDAEAAQGLDRIISSTQRAADLTRQLLAFARKQPLKPQPTSINDVVSGTGGMLVRTLGEQIVTKTVLARDLWSTSVDRAQLESSLVNLCLNARDAMPAGGRLLIETRNVTLDDDYAMIEPDVVAGEYAMLAVSDTGEGIPADVLGHVFEPFVTTKEVGKGTGLGLSMVYGFIKQSNGHIKIYSEVGHGTTVRIYLPRDREIAVALEKLIPSLPRGNERILVVEDDGFVRESVVLQLRALGYVVGEADNAASGLERQAEDAAYDLLLTDVVMPGAMNGKTFAVEAVRRQPDLHVLFMSGYTENALIHNGHLEEGIHLLSKPFRKIDLARAVRNAMGGSAYVAEGGTVSSPLPARQAMVGAVGIEPTTPPV
jgi:signal transduction histidine kinase